MIALKEGVRFTSLPSPMLDILRALDAVWKKELPGIDPVITAAYEPSGHMTESYHYLGYAIDVRSKNINGVELKESVLRSLRNALPTPRFDVILENVGKEMEHYHIEYNHRQYPE